MAIYVRDVVGSWTS